MKPIELEIGLLTGGVDKSYAFGLAMALTARGVGVDFIGSNEVDRPDLHKTPHLRFLNLRGSQRPDVDFVTKLRRVLLYYARLFYYASVAKPKIFHVLWNSRFEALDRTLVMLYYKLMAKKIALTAHNVNAGQRDSNDSLLNRLTLRIQYRLADHVFVHTERMKAELIRDFGVRHTSVTVIPLGINNSVPDTPLTSSEARQRLRLRGQDKTLLFFGNIGPYKGLEFLIEAFQHVAAKDSDYRLLIAGHPKKGHEKYWAQIQQAAFRDIQPDRVRQRIEYIPDAETEMYFKAADVLVLPYTHVFQSGVLILGYTFGLPVIAADVGSLREDVIEGTTGYLCRRSDSADLAKTIERYFESALFKNLATRRSQIRDYAKTRYSWDAVGELTLNVYNQLLAESNSRAPARAPM